MIMDAAPATIILSPILLKIVPAPGRESIQLGVIIVMNLSIGMITPPVGINLFVGCKISKIQLESTLKFALQLLVYMLVVLALTTYIPAISFSFRRCLHNQVRYSWMSGRGNLRFKTADGYNLVKRAGRGEDGNGRGKEKI